jgi:4-diphosphocytidyl-2-C-methyl-D-erythritol kinase
VNVVSLPAPIGQQVTARAPAKINIQLAVGPRGSDGFHSVATVYQAVSLFDEVTITSVQGGSGMTLEITGEEAAGLAPNEDNLAALAVKSLAKKIKVSPDCHVRINKAIPIAAGLAGGSADAAAALVAANSLWGNPLARDQLAAIAATLGSDVPFSLQGGTAVGHGRGDKLTPTLCRGEFAWVLAFADGTISTPEAYSDLDTLRAGESITPPAIDERVLVALASGDAEGLGAVLANDLQAPAIRKRPGLAVLLDYGMNEGALGALVSGSGPTCIFLARDNDHAIDLAVRLSGGAVCRTVRRVTGPVPGARVSTTT